MTSRHSPASVMLIGDDEQLLRMMTWILLEAGYYVWKCANVEEALRHSKDLRPDVILVDGPADMPKGAAVEELRAAYTDARFIGIHVHGDPPHRHMQAEGHLHKPFHADDLLAEIEQVRGQAVGASSAHKH
jgi:DNA-binding response OmpR family regulator